jgi:hypothetical protein
METLRAVFGFLTIFTFIGLIIWWHFSRSPSILEQWADKNGYWVRCGSWFFGLLSENVQVRWKD